MQKHRDGQKIRLAFFSFGILEQGGGFENYMIETASDLVGYRDVFEAVVITATPALTEKLQKLLSIYFLKKHDIKNIYRENTASIKKRLGKARYFQVRSLKELVKLVNLYDYIYSKNEILELVILKLIKRRINAKIIIGVHTPIYYPYTPSFSAKLHNFLYTGFFYKWLLNDADSIKVNNEDDKDYLKNKFNFQNVDVVHHAFKTRVTEPIYNNDSRLRVLFVGRITEQKGIDRLISVIEVLNERNKLKNYQFKIVGSGEDMLVRQLQAATNRWSNIEYSGHIQNENVNNFYDWTDISIIPSRYETLNKVAVETAIAGKVAVSSDIAGPREVIEDKITGYLITPSIENFVDTLEQCFYHKGTDDILKIMGRNAQKKIEKEFKPSVVYNSFYEQLLKRD